MTIRLLNDNDRAQAKALWQSTFDDPPAFVDWFFENRFLPSWSVGVFDEDRPISIVHGAPMELSLGPGASFSALMTSGVATVPQERGRGHMYAAMRFLEDHARQQGIHALFNHPQQPGTYAHLGFRPSTYTRYWNGEGAYASGTIVPFSEEEAFQVYSAIADRYAGFVRRDRASFHLKMADYASAEAKGFLMQEAGEIVGYCIYFDTEEVVGEEVLSLTEYGPILHELKRIAGSKNVSAKLPPDVDAAGEIRPQNVMLASEEIWQTLQKSGRTCFCVDEY